MSAPDARPPRSSNPLYRARWWFVALAFLLTWFFLYAVMSWAEGRFEYVNERLDAVDAPTASELLRSKASERP